jgi:hypothetical protein
MNPVVEWIWKEKKWNFILAPKVCCVAVDIPLRLVAAVLAWLRCDHASLAYSLPGSLAPLAVLAPVRVPDGEPLRLPVGEEPPPAL